MSVMYNNKIKHSISVKDISLLNSEMSSSSSVQFKSGADWPSGEPGEFPVAWQPIWPAALHFFFFFFFFIYIIYYYFFILLFLMPTECTKVIISEFAIQ